ITRSSSVCGTCSSRSTSRSRPPHPPGRCGRRPSASPASSPTSCTAGIDQGQVTVTTPPPQGPPLRGAYLLGGRYHLLERLSGRGATWRARDELLHRDVAITEILLPPPGPERRPLLQ